MSVIQELKMKHRTLDSWRTFTNVAAIGIFLESSRTQHLADGSPSALSCVP